MPPKQTAGEREPQPPEEHEEVEPAATRRSLEPVEVEAEAMGQDRPYQDFVESKARKYWQEMVKVGSLSKPAWDEIRAAAMPVLCQTQRRRTGWSPWAMALHAVNGMQLRASERGWIKPPYSRLSESPSYIDALTQLADDAGWLAKEIPLPDHPPPKHPTIYYTIDPKSNRPIPRENSLIRADYVYKRDGSLLTQTSHIHPSLCPDGPDIDEVVANGLDACYALNYEDGTVNIFIYWVEQSGDMTMLCGMPLSLFHFSAYPQRFFID